MKFFGREMILSQLNELWGRKTSALVTCRGRRRIGKSTLIKHYAESSGAKLLAFEGYAPEPGMTNADQLLAFSRQFAEQCGKAFQEFGSWFDAFKALGNEVRDGERTVVLLDEISWMGKYDPMFPSELKYAYDQRFHDREDLVVVVCGSVSSWINKNILANTGFVGRVSMDIIVPELTLSECVNFWGDRKSRVAAEEIIDVLSVTGGVPRYLEEIKPELSADENIKRMCFRPNGYLFRDFNDIFTTVFSARSPLKRAVLARLADGSASGAELAEALGVARNGQFSELLEELEMAGFVAADSGLNPENGKRSKEIRYRLRDNYSRFYLKYVEPHSAEIVSGRYEFVSVENLPEWSVIMGLQFENLVVNNFKSLLPYLHLNGVQVFSAAPFRKFKNDEERGVQVDLLVQTRKSVVIVEIKHQSEIGESVEAEVSEKIRRLDIPAEKSVRTALVYSGRLTKGVRGNGYFDSLVPIAELLGARSPESPVGAEVWNLI